jgi:hypothetical protein
MVLAMTGQHEYDATVILKDMKPSVAKSLRTFLASLANSGSKLSRAFHASAYDGCTINPSCLFVQSLCHLMCIAVFLERNKCFTLGVRGMCEAVYVQPLSPPSPHLHLQAPRTFICHILSISALCHVPSKRACSCPSKHQSSHTPYQDIQSISWTGTCLWASCDP